MSEPVFTAEEAHDLLRGAAAYAASPLIGDLADAAARLPQAPFSIAFNPKQIASKRWLLDQTARVLGGAFDEIVVLGGWLGVLSAMFLADPRFAIRRVVSLDIDPACEAPARLLNQRHVAAGVFRCVTADMYDYAPAPLAAGARRLIVNTSAEHIADPGAWAARLPRGAFVAVQSNNYRAIPEHVSCVDSADELAARLGLAETLFAGGLPLKRYTRFMAIGRT